MDFYCKNFDCPCSEIAFYIFLEGDEGDIELGRVFYDYKTKKVKPSKYSHLLQTDFLEDINKELEARHIYVKIQFKLAQMERLKDLLATLSNNKKTSKTTSALSAKINRNDPCSCGSGKKYKRCCGK